MKGHDKLVIHYKKLERISRDKHSSLLGPFVSLEENGYLRVGPMYCSEILDWAENICQGQMKTLNKFTIEKCNDTLPNDSSPNDTWQRVKN